MRKKGPRKFTATLSNVASQLVLLHRCTRQVAWALLGGAHVTEVHKQSHVLAAARPVQVTAQLHQRSCRSEGPGSGHIVQHPQDCETEALEHK